MGKAHGSSSQRVKKQKQKDAGNVFMEITLKIMGVISVMVGITAVTVGYMNWTPEVLDHFLGRMKTVTLATSGIKTETFANLSCSSDYAGEKFPGCSPKICGRAVTDYLINAKDLAGVLSMAKRGLAMAKPSGGAAILDFHSGAISHGSKFVNLYQVYKDKEGKDPFSQSDFDLYNKVQKLVKKRIASHFGLDSSKLYLTSPSFFSQMTSKPATTIHDEYWHSHVDKHTYGTFHYTALLYLADYGLDFEGGKFVFVDKTGNSTIEPQKGRVSFFTSGSENVHYVEKVSQGLRMALTIAFTCDSSKANSDLNAKITAKQ